MDQGATEQKEQEGEREREREREREIPTAGLKDKIEGLSQLRDARRNEG